MRGHYLIKWQNAEALGSVDLIKASLLKARQPKQGLTHATRIGRSVLISTFDIVPDGDALLFRYGGVNTAANKAEGIYRGDMRLTPEEFAVATTIAWRDAPDHEWELVPVKIEKLMATEGIRRARRGTSVSRDTALAFFKRADAKARGELTCEACGFAGFPAYGDANDRCFEVHHKHHIADGARVSELDDLVIICANCHNALHGLGDLMFQDFKANFV